MIADSAQFSAAITELAEPRYAGSVLAMQLALGFTLTIVSIRLVPLAIGLLLGTVAMLRRGLLRLLERAGNQQAMDAFAGVFAGTVAPGEVLARRAPRLGSRSESGTGPLVDAGDGRPSTAARRHPPGPSLAPVE